MSWNSDQLVLVADILIAAASADGVAQDVERGTVRAIVKELGAPTSMLDKRIKGFDAASFDLKKTAASLNLKTSAERRELLQLVARVTESDDVHDLDESDFIVAVAKAIGATKDEYAGLTISLEESKPPPLPST